MERREKQPSSADGSRTPRLQALTGRDRGLRAVKDVLRATDTHLVKAVRINSVIDLHVRSLSEAPVYSSFYTPRSIKTCRGEGGSWAGGAFVLCSDSLWEWVSALPPTFTHPCCLICLSSFTHHGGGFGLQGQYYVSHVSCMHVKPESGQTYTHANEGQGLLFFFLFLLISACRTKQEQTDCPALAYLSRLRRWRTEQVFTSSRH